MVVVRGDALSCIGAAGGGDKKEAPTEGRRKLGNRGRTEDYRDLGPRE